MESWRKMHNERFTTLTFHQTLLRSSNDGGRDGGAHST